MSPPWTVDPPFPITTVILSHAKALDLCFGRYSLIYCHSTNPDSQVDEEENIVSFHLHKDILSKQALPKDPQSIK